MKSFFIAPPVGGGRSRKLNDPPLVALRSRRCSSECEVAPLGIGIQAIQLFALSRGSCGTTPSAPSSDPRFSDMLFSPPAFRLQVNRMTQEHSSGLLLTASGIQHRVPRRTLAPHTAQAFTNAPRGTRPLWQRPSRSAPGADGPSARPPSLR